MAAEKLFTQREWDANEDEWSKLTNAWKARAEKAEAELKTARRTALLDCAFLFDDRPTVQVVEKRLAALLKATK
jgi:hypothetical protein